VRKLRDGVSQTLHSSDLVDDSIARFTGQSKKLSRLDVTGRNRDVSAPKVFGLCQRPKAKDQRPSKRFILTRREGLRQGGVCCLSGVVRAHVFVCRLGLTIFRTVHPTFRIFRPAYRRLITKLPLFK
jgi:hypothetical protein